MYYEKDTATGRLTSSSLKTPTNMGAVPETQGILYAPGTVFPKEQPPRRGFYGPVPEALIEKMRLFQCHNSIPIHLKGGPVDKVLFGSTLVLCAVGLAGCFQFFYGMAFPKKN